jgi:hypothetical protein
MRIRYIRSCPYGFKTAPLFLCIWFLFSVACRYDLGPIHPRFQWVSHGIKRLLREADHSPPTSAEVNNGGSTRIPPLPTRLRGVVLN